MSHIAMSERMRHSRLMPRLYAIRVEGRAVAWQTKKTAPRGQGSNALCDQADTH